MLRIAWPFKSVNSVLKVFFILHVFIRVIRLHQLEGGPVYNLLRFELQENIINSLQDSGLSVLLTFSLLGYPLYIFVHFSLFLLAEGTQLLSSLRNFMGVHQLVGGSTGPE